jgi:hypothetical protein
VRMRRERHFWRRTDYIGIRPKTLHDARGGAARPAIGLVGVKEQIHVRGFAEHGCHCFFVFRVATLDDVGEGERLCSIANLCPQAELHRGRPRPNISVTNGKVATHRAGGDRRSL